MSFKGKIVKLKKCPRKSTTLSTPGNPEFRKNKTQSTAMAHIQSIYSTVAHTFYHIPLNSALCEEFQNCYWQFLLQILHNHRI